MQVLLGVFLFSLLLTTGAGLECAICTEEENIANCTSKKTPCSLEQDICMIELSEISVGGVVTQLINKGCSFSHVCVPGPVYDTFGPGNSARRNTYCCKAEACESVTPQLPPVITKLNGKQCPGCYSRTNSCSEVVMAQCVGLQNYCFDSMVSFVSHGTARSIITKGCTTENFCAGIQNSENTVGDGTISVKAQCEPASQASSISGSLLLALFGFLFL